MIEIFIFIVGVLIGFAIAKQQPKHTLKWLKQSREENNKLEDDIRKTSDEVRALKCPDRLINEFKGEEGSEIFKLQEKMKHKINNERELFEELENGTYTLEVEIEKLEIKKKTLSNDLNTRLDSAYLMAIDDLDKIVQQAMKKGYLEKNKTIELLKQKSKELQEKAKNRD